MTLRCSPSSGRIDPRCSAAMSAPSAAACRNHVVVVIGSARSSDLARAALGMTSDAEPYAVECYPLTITLCSTLFVSVGVGAVLGPSKISLCRCRP